MAGDGRSSLRRNARKSSACSPPADRRPRSPDCSRRTARRSAGSTLRRVKPRQSELPGSRYVRKFGRKSTDRVLGPITRAVGKGKTEVWRWQERFMGEGVEGLTRDK